MWGVNTVVAGWRSLQELATLATLATVAESSRHALATVATFPTTGSVRYVLAEGESERSERDHALPGIGPQPATVHAGRRCYGGDPL